MIQYYPVSLKILKRKGIPNYDSWLWTRIWPIKKISKDILKSLGLIDLGSVRIIYD